MSFAYTAVSYKMLMWAGRQVLFWDSCACYMHISVPIWLARAFLREWANCSGPAVGFVCWAAPLAGFAGATMPVLGLLSVGFSQGGREAGYSDASNGSYIVGHVGVLGFEWVVILWRASSGYCMLGSPMAGVYRSRGRI